LLSESTNDESFSGPIFPMGRLGHHVGIDSNVTDGSFQDRSLTSSVGVELGVHTVSASSPALKRVFGNPKKVEPLLTPHAEHGGADLESPQKVAYSLSPEEGKGDCNPFSVRYSARGSPISERHGLYDVGSPNRSGDSSGGWTPVPLSSSGMISDDFVLDSTATPMGKHEVPIKPLFSADRVPSTSRSPFSKFYREEPSNEPSFDSDKVGPPDIHRVTSSPTTTPMKAFESAEPTSHAVTDTVPESPSSEMNHDKALGNDDAAVKTRPSPTQILAYNRARRRVLRNRKQHLTPRDEKPDAGTNLKNAAEQTQSSSKSPVTDTVAPRNLFPSREATGNVHLRWSSKLKGTGATYKDYSEAVDSNVEKDVNETSAVSNEIHNDRLSDKQPFSAREATRNVYPRWSSKLKGNGSTNKDDSEAVDRNVGKDRKEAPAISNEIDNGRVSDEQLFPSREATRNVYPRWSSELQGNGSTNKDDSEAVDRNVGKDRKEAPAVSNEIHNDRVSDKQLFPSRDETSNVYPRWSSKLKGNASTNKDDSEAVDRNFGKDLKEAPAVSNEIGNARVSDEQLRSEEVKDASTSKSSPPSSSLSVRDRINKFSPPKDATNYVPPWAAKLKGKRAINKDQQEGFDHDVSAGKDSPETRAALDETDENNHDKQYGRKPLNSDEVRGISALKPSPLSSSVRDRIRALSAGKSEPSRLTPINVQMIVDTSPPKRGDGQSRDGSQPVTSTTVQSTGDDSQTNSGTTSSFSVNRSPAGALPLNAIPSQATLPEDSSEKIQIEAKYPKTSRNRLVLGAHLAATVDDVSPQDRYRWRSKKVDDATVTDDSQDVSDVRSLKSFFEASLATAPSDESGDDDDDRTVESIRSIFEPAPKKEEPSAVSKMRAMFEKQTTAATGEKFAGNNAVSDAFIKFQPSGPRRSPTKWVQPSKFKSPFASPGDDVDVPASSAKQAVTKSAPSKLQSSVFQSPFASERPEAKSEDRNYRRRFHESAADGKTTERAPVDPPVMSVAERIRALKLKQNHQKQMDSGVGGGDDAPENPPTLPSVSPQSIRKGMSPLQAPETATAIVSPQSWKCEKPSPVTSDASGKDRTAPRDPNVAAKSKESSPLADGTEQSSSVKLSGGNGASYPSVMDRINVFSGNAETMFESDTVQKSPSNHSKSFQRGGMRRSQPAPDGDGTDGNLLHLSTRALYGRKEDTDDVQGEPKQKNRQHHAEPAEEMGAMQDAVIPDQHAHDAQQLHRGREKGGPARAAVVVSKKPLKTESCRVSDAGTSGTGSEFDDGVTLDLSIAEISQLTNPTCLRSQAGGTDSDCGAASDHTSAAGEQVGKGPSEASSSQPSEAMVPLIARMRFSDDGSASVHSAKGASNGRLDDLKWEPLTAVDETTRTPPTEKEHESAWSPDDVNATFPVSASHFDAAFAAGDKLWQPLQADNWEASPSFRTDWTPPAIDPYETPTSEARLSDATPIRRNTNFIPTARDDSHRSSPIQGDARGRPSSRGFRPSSESKMSPINGALFRRTHPTRYETNRKEQGVASETTPKERAAVSTSPSQTASNIDETFPRSSPPSHIHGLNTPTVPATPRSSPLQPLEGAASDQEAAPSTRGSPPPTSSGSSKHALLLSKLRSMKEARMRRNAASGFIKNSIYPSERQSRRPPTGNARTSPTTSALAPFLRPSFGSPRQTRSPNATQYRRPEHTVDDEYSTSTNRSLDFGGHKFTDSLDVD
jgi:hypothetical protein